MSKVFDLETEIKDGYKFVYMTNEQFDKFQKDNGPYMEIEKDTKLDYTPLPNEVGIIMGYRVIIKNK